jgi:hypothetical protein
MAEPLEATNNNISYSWQHQHGQDRASLFIRKQDLREVGMRRRIPAVPFCPKLAAPHTGLR